MLWAFQLKQVSFSTSMSELEEAEDRKALAPKYIYIYIFRIVRMKMIVTSKDIW